MARRPEISPDLLRKLRAELNRKRPPFGLPRNEAEQNPVPAPHLPTRRPTAEEQRLDKIHDSLRWMSQSASNQWQERFYRHYGNSRPKTADKFEVVLVTEDGKVGATCITADTKEKYNTLLSFDFPKRTITGYCSCLTRNDQQLCRHRIGLADHIVTQLSEERSELSRTILKGDFDTEYDLQDYQPDRAEIRLGHFNSLLGTANAESVDDSLPEREQALPERLLWNYRSSASAIEKLTLCWQQGRKRGDGWKKPQPVSSEKMTSYRRLISSPNEARAFNAYEQSVRVSYLTYSHYRDASYVVRTLEELIDNPCVTVDEEPATVHPTALHLILAEEGDSYILRQFIPAKTDRFSLQVENNGFVACFKPTAKNPTHELYVGRCNESQHRILKALAEDPLKFKKAKLPTYLPKLLQLSKQIPIIFPEQDFGAVRQDTTRPVLLLRWYSSGQIDLGLRVLDAQSRLFRPGAGPLVYQQSTDNEIVQWRRDPAAEIHSARDIANRLDISDLLDQSTWFVSISEFKQAFKLLTDLEELGDEVELRWDKKTEEQPSILGTLTSKNVRVRLTNKRDWFGLEGDCLFDKKQLSLNDVLDGVLQNRWETNGEGGFVQIGKGQWAQISKSLFRQLRRLADHSHSERGKRKVAITAAEAVEDLVQSEAQIEAPPSWEKTLERLHTAKSLQPVVPSGLKAELRDYQKEGFAWMRRLAELGIGGVLADDMGLGKTVQTLAVLIDRQAAGPTLIVAPTSLGFNWSREVERFAPELRPHIYRETDRNEFLKNIGPGDLVIASYGLVLRDSDALEKVSWGTLVLDEAQAIKNSEAKTTKAVTSLKADWKIALTGTPVENHLGELWSIFKAISPGLLGSWDQFRNKFAAPIERDNCPHRREALTELLRPFILRRTKKAVLQELPDRTETNLYVDLTAEERNRYNQLRLTALTDLSQKDESQNAGEYRLQLLALLTKLRQSACHAGLIDDNWNGSSSKLELMLEKLDELTSEGHRALIFSQFTSHLAKIRSALDQRKVEYLYLDGSTPAKQRGELVDRFQNGEGSAFLISLKAGGTGLNLTAADYVIHMDPWWNPAVEDQATDRAHRIGQTNPVMVYRIIARDTIEEEILRLHDSKRDLVAGILDGTSSAAKLSSEQLVALIRGTSNND